jgi:hypothetical protein
MFKLKFVNYNRIITVSIMLITLFALVTILKYFKLYEGLNTKMQDNDDDNSDDNGDDVDDDDDDYSKYKNTYNNKDKDLPTSKINLNFYTQDVSQPTKRRKYKSSKPIPTKSTLDEFNNLNVNPNLITTTY